MLRIVPLILILYPVSAAHTSIFRMDSCTASDDVRGQDAPRQGRVPLQGYLAHKKPPPPRTLQQAYAYGPVVVLGGGLVSYERGTPAVVTKLSGPPATSLRDVGAVDRVRALHLDREGKHLPALVSR
jgi:hypothetical protein